jgi:hypothetical protein
VALMTTPRFLRYLRIAFSATCLIACVLLIALWVRNLPTSSVVLDEVRVLSIAREAVAANDEWLDRAEFETSDRQPDGSWHVLVWRRPATPGGHRFITINANGRVIDYVRGL